MKVDNKGGVAYKYFFLVANLRFQISNRPVTQRSIYAQYSSIMDMDAFVIKLFTAVQCKKRGCDNSKSFDKSGRPIRVI